jgi:hypothetical protein
MLKLKFILIHRGWNWKIAQNLKIMDFKSYIMNKKQLILKEQIVLKI